jgi:hypothetical protein
MSLTIPSGLRYRVVNFLESNPSSVVTSFFQGLLLIALILMATPWRVSREIAYGLSAERQDLKSSLRALMWVWNRSWVPFGINLGTYFDIGWYLSADSCDALVQRRFISNHPLKRLCDLAQLKLSTIKNAVAQGDQARLLRADQELRLLVSEVLNGSYAWAVSNESTVNSRESIVAGTQTPRSNHGASFDNARTRSALLDFDDLCRLSGMRYFLVSGTLLGVVRDGTFIGHDHDIDVGIFEDEPFEDLIAAVSNSKNFVLTQEDIICMRRTNDTDVQYAYLEIPAIIRLAHRTGISIDVFIHFREGNLIWHGSSVYRWDNTNFDLKRYEFLGRSFLGAEDFDRYLTENYGSDWRTPKQKFNVNFDTPNMSYVGTPNAMVFFSWLSAGAIQDQDPTSIRKYIDLLSSLGIVEIKERVISVR